MVFRADTRAVRTISGIGPWPRAATLDAVARAGHGRIPVGPGRWVVPAAVDAWLTTLRLHGTMSAAEVLAPAIELAERGFPANYFIRKNLRDAAAVLRTFPSTSAVFLPGGEVPAEGAPIRQPELAATLRLLVAAEGRAGGTRGQGIQAARDAFYKGEIAAEVGRFAREIGFLGVGVYPRSGFVHVDVRTRSFFWVEGRARRTRGRRARGGIREVLGDVARRADEAARARGVRPLGGAAEGATDATDDDDNE
jgi:hypothetical protein